MLLVVLAYMASALLGFSDPGWPHNGHITSEMRHLPDNSPASISTDHRKAMHVPTVGQPPAALAVVVGPCPDVLGSSPEPSSLPSPGAILASWLYKVVCDLGPWIALVGSWDEAQQSPLAVARCHRSVVLHL